MFAQWFGNRWGLGALLVRLSLAAVFMANGYTKLFVMGLDGTIQAFQGMGIPAPNFWGPLVAFIEFFGGIAVALGLFTRYVALMFTVILVVAIFTVKLKLGIISAPGSPPGYELDLALLGESLLLLLTGPGLLSLERVLFKKEL